MWPPGAESPPRHPTGPAIQEGCGSQAGYTLAELLTVLGIMALLASMSAAAILSLPQRYAHEQAESQLQALLRRARSAALDTRSSASVAIDGFEVTARVWRPLLLLRFEEIADGPDGGAVAVGARGLRAAMHGAVPDPGRFGDALYFEEPGAYVDCGASPVLSPTDGLRLRAWVRPGRIEDLVGAEPERPAPPGEPRDAPWMFQIAAKGEEYFLWLREDMALIGGLGPRGARGSLLAETPPRALEPDRWHEVEMVWDEGGLRILVDGLRRDVPGRAAESAGERGQPFRPSAAPLLLSSPEPGLSFFGGLDEVRLDGVVAEASFELPGGIELEGPAWVRFDRRGELDPLAHDRPVTFTVRLAGARTDDPDSADAPRIVRVERSGLVR